MIKKWEHKPDGAIDYSQCEKEPITQPGAIQSYGGLIAVQAGKVIAHSKNIHLFLSVGSNPILQQKLSELSPGLNQRLQSVSAQLTSEKTYFQTLDPWIVGFRKVGNDLFYIEFFPQPSHPLDVQGLEEEIEQIARKFHFPAKNRSQFLSDVCQIFQKYLGFDQVFTQVLQEEETIEIVAEANNGKIEPVLGLHFSSKEIPSQARALYLKQLIRFKQAAQSTAVDIVSDTSSGVDLTHSLLREPSKFMTVYMQNISASTLLSCSIVMDHKLSALLTMHHADPMNLDPRSFEPIVTAVNRVALELLRIDDLIKKNADSKLWELLNQAFPLDRLGAVEKLIHAPQLEKFIAHCGAVITKDGKILSSRGQCPEPKALENLLLETSKIADVINYSSKMTEDFRLEAAVLGEFAGVMVIRFEGTSLLLFRKAFHTEILWRNASPVGLEKDTNLPRFSPAGSFQFFVQEFENRSRPWSEKDIAFARVVANWMSEDFES